MQQIPFMDHEPHPCWFCRPQALLRAKALECISLVGMAVGRDRFRADAHEVMKFMQALQVRLHIRQFSQTLFIPSCSKGSGQQQHGNCYQVRAQTYASIKNVLISGPG